jgi:Regulator of chromosome condensation (RCC1) repeat/Putative Ig domain
MFTPPAGLNHVIAVAVGYSHSLALKDDGTVVAWGPNGGLGGFDYGQVTVPAGLSGVVAIAAGDLHSLALKSNGTVLAWGYNNVQQTTVPTDLGKVTAIGAAGYNSMAFSPDAPTPPPWHYAFLASPVAISTSPPLFSIPNYTATNLPPGLSIHPTTGVISGTCVLAGTWHSTVQVTNPLQSKTEQLAIYVEPISTDYTTWASIHWPVNTAANAPTNADPDHDGRTNLMEYALRTQPVEDNTVPSPILSHDAAGHLVLEMDVADRGSNVSWTAQFTSNLQFAGALVASPFISSGAAPGFVRLRFTDPLSTPTARRLARLRVNMP